MTDLPIKQFILHGAVANGNHLQMIKTVKEGADVNSIMRGIGTPLNLAIRYKRPGMVNFLLVWGADPNSFITIPRGDWYVLDDFYDMMRTDNDTLYILFKYGANPYLARDAACQYFLPYFWQFVKQCAKELVVSLPHLSAHESIAILEGMCQGADNIPYHKKWALVTSKHLFEY